MGEWFCQRAIRNWVAKQGMTMKNELKNKNVLKGIGAVVAAGLLVVAVVSLANRGGRKGDSTTIYTTVQEGPLVINISEAGSIKPREQITIKSEVEGRTTILFLVPEGTRVQKGQLLVELDTSELANNRVDQDILVQNADSAFVTAKENLDVVSNQAKSDVELADLTLRFAMEDLEKYNDGEYPTQLNEAKGNVTLAEEELVRAREKYEWSKKLYEENYLSETELKSDELSWKRCDLNVKTAKGNLDLLERYTYKREVAKLQSDVSQNKMALERAKSKASSDLVQAQVSLRAKELEFNRQKERLTKIDEQIKKARIVAPMDGLVIYTTSGQQRWGDGEPLAEGQEVRERQELIYLPTGDTFQAEVDVHESNLKKIYPGLPVRIRVDAVPGQVFSGTVVKISPLPDGQRSWINPDLKIYKTQININGGGDVLKTGMNCQAEIIVEQHEKTVYVPVQSVTRVNNEPSVWIKTPAGDERRIVKIGLDNNRFVRIIDGLKPGEEIMLSPPLSSSVSGHSTEVMKDVVIPTLQDSQKKAEADSAAVLKRESKVVGAADGKTELPTAEKPVEEKKAAPAPSVPKTDSAIKVQSSVAVESK